MNKIILLGNLTRDPEIRYTQGENPLAVARFSMAINRKFARQGDTDVDYFNCTAFGKQAEFVEKYFHKGSRMLLTGRVQNDNYTNNNGEKVYSIQVIAEEIEFAERKNRATDHGSNGFSDHSAASKDFMNISDGIENGLPFN